jgi:hypothetical protein
LAAEVLLISLFLRQADHRFGDIDIQSSCATQQNIWIAVSD